MADISAFWSRPKKVFLLVNLSWSLEAVYSPNIYYLSGIFFRLCPFLTSSVFLHVFTCLHPPLSSQSWLLLSSVHPVSTLPWTHTFPLPASYPPLRPLPPAGSFWSSLFRTSFWPSWSFFGGYVECKKFPSAVSLVFTLFRLLFKSITSQQGCQSLSHWLWLQFIAF